MVDYTFLVCRLDELLSWLFIKFILPEFVSYLGEIGVLCVRNG